MPPSVRETFTATLNFASGGTLTTDAISIENRKKGAAMMVLIPSGFAGILQVKASDFHDGTFYDAYDHTGTLIQVDPTSKILPSWHMVNVDVFPALYIKFSSVASSAGTAGSAQSAARAVKVMGLS